MSDDCIRVLVEKEAALAASLEALEDLQDSFQSETIRFGLSLQSKNFTARPTTTRINLEKLKKFHVQTLLSIKQNKDKAGFQ